MCDRARVYGVAVVRCCADKPSQQWCSCNGRFILLWFLTLCNGADILLGCFDIVQWGFTLHGSFDVPPYLMQWGDLFCIGFCDDMQWTTEMDSEAFGRCCNALAKKRGTCSFR